MFRAEMMDPKTLWLACYLDGASEADSRITFMVTFSGGRLSLTVTEFPEQ